MKRCSAPGCVNYSFSHGFCQRHQFLRTDSKKPQRAIKTRTEKKPAHTIDFGFENQQDMFTALWENAKDAQGNVKCSYTGEKLNKFYGTDMWYSCFMHVLPKGQYTYWKLNPENIRIALPDFHKIVDQGTFADREKHPGWRFDIFDTEKELLKLQYKHWKAKNLLP